MKNNLNVINKYNLCLPCQHQQQQTDILRNLKKGTRHYIELLIEYTNLFG